MTIRLNSGTVYKSACNVFTSAEACATYGLDQPRNVPRPYFPVAALNLTTSSAGTRPRSLTSMPCVLAHSRTSVVFRPFAARCVRCGLAAG